MLFYDFGKTFERFDEPLVEKIFEILQMHNILYCLSNITKLALSRMNALQMKNELIYVEI